MMRRAAALLLGALAAAACSSDKRTVLTVYSPHGPELLKYFEEGFEKAHPEIDVQWVDMGSQEVLDRVRAEKDNPQASALYGIGLPSMLTLKADGLLQPYKSPEAATIPARYKDPDGWWTTIRTCWTLLRMAARSWCSTASTR